MMYFNTYQNIARKFRLKESSGLAYAALGLAGEAGEVANKIKKVLRKDPGITDDAILDELGDVLWYVAMIADDLGLGLYDVAERNIQKLNNRAAEGKLKGSGDNR